MMSSHGLQSKRALRRSRLTVLLAASGLSVCAGAVASCGDTGAGHPTPGAISGFSAADVGQEAGAPKPTGKDAAGAHSDAPADSGSHAPPLVQSIPDPGCMPATGARSIVVPASLEPPSFDRLASLGDRMVAGGTLSQGILTFDSSGGAADKVAALGPNYNLFAARDQLVAMTASTNSGVVFQLYDELLQAVGLVVELAATAADAMAITAGQGRWLVTWAASGSVFARIVDSAGVAAPPQVVAQNAYQSVIRIAASQSSHGFAVAIASDPPGEGRGTRVVNVGGDGEAIGTVTLPSELSSHALEKIEQTTAGHVLLLSGGPPAQLPVIVLIDPSGKASAFALEGGLHGSDLAVGQDRILVAATRITGEPQVRAFDAKMQPLGPWVCLGAPADPDDALAVHARPQGFDAMYRTPEGAAAWLLESGL